jgi:hypothetical protein
MNNKCVRCSVATDPTNGEFCFICEDLKDVCWNCMSQHLTESHTQIDYMKIEQELTA